MHTSDIRILRLIDLLIFQNKIDTDRAFAMSISMLPQTISKIKNGTSHFTPKQIESICKVYNVNANWIFGIQDNVFNMKNSIKITF